MSKKKSKSEKDHKEYMRNYMKKYYADNREEAKDKALRRYYVKLGYNPEIVETLMSLKAIKHRITAPC